MLSLVLKLPPTYLWQLSSNENERFDLFRYALYHPPTTDEDTKTEGVRLQGHTDFNSVSRASSFGSTYPTVVLCAYSVLYSQPIVSLQVLMPDNVWRYVKHVPNALVINLGDAMHCASSSLSSSPYVTHKAEQSSLAATSNRPSTALSPLPTKPKSRTAVSACSTLRSSTALRALRRSRTHP